MKKLLNDYYSEFPRPEREYKIYTDQGGMEMLHEALKRRFEEISKINLESQE